MSAETRISSKGQVVIPKDVRERMHWPPGTTLELVERPGSVVLQAKRPARKTLTVEEALARIRARTAPYLPAKPATVEQISSVPEEFLRDHFARKFSNTADD